MKIIFILAFFISIFSFSKENIDWCIIPNIVTTFSFLSIITAFLLCKKKELTITPWFIITTLFTGILYLIGNKYIYSQYILLSSIITFLIFLKDNSHTNYFSEIQLARIFPFILVVEAIFGIMQFIQTGQPMQVKGHFDNTIGFTSSLSFSIPFLLYLTKHDTKIFKKYAHFMLGIICIALFLACSRSVLVTSFIIILLYQHLHSSWNQHNTITRLAYYLLFIGIAFVVYQLKQDSANGRLLIWSIALSMIWEHPWGYGIGGVARKYMNYQAKFLSHVQDHTG